MYEIQTQTRIDGKWTWMGGGVVRSQPAAEARVDRLDDGGIKARVVDTATDTVIYGSEQRTRYKVVEHTPSRDWVIEVLPNYEEAQAWAKQWNEQPRHPGATYTVEVNR